MYELIKSLDENLQYANHEIIEDTIYLSVISTREKTDCPNCGQSSSRVHSRYIRSFQDLPIQDKKLIVVLYNRKLFCENPDCKNVTFAETFSFLPSKGKKSIRLIDKIIDISLNVSSMTASSILGNGVVDIGKSTICRMLKKTKFQLYKKNI
jgi:transposase